MLFVWLFVISFVKLSTSQHILTPRHFVRDGETLLSRDGTFELGFFSPGTSTNRYLGIWYRNVFPKAVVWVANRESPIKNNSGILTINNEGVLVILVILINGTNSSSPVWSSNVPSEAVINPIAQLLETGNLVVKNGVKDSNNNQFLWQSFNYPGDTLTMQGMKLGWNLMTGQEIFLSSWRSKDDPSQGEYSLKIDRMGYPQLFKYKGSEKRFRIGSWNGESFSGYSSHQLKQNIRVEFIMNHKEVYLVFKTVDRSVTWIYTVTSSGHGELSAWTSQSNSRKVISTGEEDECENYALCGVYSVCNMNGNSPTCECLKGFVPKFPEQWNMSYWSNGCVSRTELDCDKNTHGFFKYTNMKVPDTSSSWFSKAMNLDECRKKCLEKCSCTAYANLDIRRGGTGCLLWFGALIDTRTFSQWGQDLYIKVPASQLDNGLSKMKKLVEIIVGVILFGFITCVSIMIHRRQGLARIIYRKHYENILRKEDIGLPNFDLSVLAKATDNFSSSNKLGEGGFGPVYKGTLTNGQELAVKMLSERSVQGMEEFRNEILLIAKLQHRNLVKLLGCCIQEEKVMLIYEYMSNKSLDHFIFDENRRKLLDWPTRFNIIGGIARGLLYLHQDSRLRIIHRDLKTSNILLDANMEPKISDFGLARTILGDQVGAKTNKVAGTYGYMSPEYAVRGLFSMKSDVFSFGVIVLEIISEQKNREFSDPEHCHNLLGHAWKLWTEGRQLELLDEVLREGCTPFEVIRCIHVALLCVQQKPQDRPDMSSVVLMLNGEKLLPKPRIPGFYSEGDVTSEGDALLTKCTLLSPNETSITILEAR
ncbi:G-type lectin S-receptor-like serine/threonine-protein kinase At4g27290 isoform X1 [Arachis stenosperma]|uniref:G-type lectin S-receptor-like serine/threonine-protein kinase At4g27290 isoform X1 n=1 Tax=Arachis stenosperma TaxID=217475 RepID=UPI0025ACEFF0|nr:G-type lectin S-receptor-like serine/threonine-protein kinase At4g27290 isoform X1 [Arachis stenosperma]